MLRRLILTALSLTFATNAHAYLDQLQACSPDNCSAQGMFCYTLPDTAVPRWHREGNTLHLSLRTPIKTTDAKGFVTISEDTPWVDTDVTLPDGTTTILLCGGHRDKSIGEVTH